MIEVGRGNLEMVNGDVCFFTRDPPRDSVFSDSFQIRDGI
jgi:hypothetical protein